MSSKNLAHVIATIMADPVVVNPDAYPNADLNSSEKIALFMKRFYLEQYRIAAARLADVCHQYDCGHVLNRKHVADHVSEVLAAVLALAQQIGVTGESIAHRVSIKKEELRRKGVRGGLLSHEHPKPACGGMTNDQFLVVVTRHRIGILDFFATRIGTCMRQNPAYPIDGEEALGSYDEAEQVLLMCVQAIWLLSAHNTTLGNSPLFTQLLESKEE